MLSCYLFQFQEDFVSLYRERERARERLEFVLTCFELHDILLRTLPKINWLKVLSPIEQSQS